MDPKGHYVPPRGPCGYKTSLMSPACTCLRFMIHPVKAATSFECDGCAHHASYHKMENKDEEEVISRWRAASTFTDADILQTDEDVVEVRKRKRLNYAARDPPLSKGILMAEKARDTLVGPNRKRIRAGTST